MTSQFSTMAEAGAGLQPMFLVEEITHRVLNEYAEAIATLRLAAAETPHLQSRGTLASAVRRLRAHAEAHRALQPPVTERPVELAQYLTEVCGCLVDAQLSESGIWLTINAEEVWLDAGRCWRVGLIVEIGRASCRERV